MNDADPRDLETTAAAVRRSLAERAAEIEPSTDAYARMAERIDRAAGGERRAARWWTRPPAIALGGLAAALALVAGIVVATDRGGDDLDVATATTPTAEATSDPAQDATPAATPGSTPEAGGHADGAPVGVPADQLAWPAADAEAPATPEEAAREFLVRFAGMTDPPLGEPREEAGHLAVDLHGRGENGAVIDTVQATIQVVPRAEGGYGVAAVVSDWIVIDTPDALEILAVDGVVGGRAWTFEGAVVARLLGRGGTELARGLGTGGGTELAPFTAPLDQTPRDTRLPGQGVLVLTGSSGADTDVVPVAAIPVQVGRPGTGPVATPPTTDGSAEVMWPVGTDAEGWYDEPGDTVDEFLTSVLDVGLVVGEVRRAGSTASVTVETTPREGLAPEVAATVELVRIRADGISGWGVVSVASDRVLLTGAEIAASDGRSVVVEVKGSATGADGTLGLAVVDAEGVLLGSSGASPTWMVELTASTGRPGFVVVTETDAVDGRTRSIAVVPIDLTGVDASIDPLTPTELADALTAAARPGGDPATVPWADEVVIGYGGAGQDRPAFTAAELADPGFWTAEREWAPPPATAGPIVASLADLLDLPAVDDPARVIGIDQPYVYGVVQADVDADPRLAGRSHVVIGIDDGATPWQNVRVYLSDDGRVVGLIVDSWIP